MNKHLVTSLTLLALFTGNTWADGVVINDTQTSVACSGDYVNGQTSGTVKYKAVWEANVYQFTLDPKRYTSADDNTGSGPNSGATGTSVIYEKYGTGWFKTGDTTTRVVSDQIEVSGADKNIVVPEYDGYGFGGYFRCKDVSGDTNCEQIITSTGFLQNDALNTLTSGGFLYAKWTANGHTISYNCGTDASGTPATQNESIDFNADWDGIPNVNAVSGSGDTTTVNGCSKNGWHPVSWSCVYGDPSSTSLNIPTSGNTTPYNVDYDATCTLQWEHNCVAKLHVKNEFLCLYTEKVSAEGNPSLVIQKSSTSPKYYAAMSPVDDNKTINSESTTKLYIKYGDDTYNVHDATVSE